MKKLRRILLFGTALLGLACSFFLPNMVAGIADRRGLNTLEIVDVQNVGYGEKPKLTELNRLALAAMPGTELLPLVTGQEMNSSTAESRAARELAAFLQGSPFEAMLDGLSAEEGSATLIANSENPSDSLISWEFRLSGENETGAIVTIDDETGMLLRLIYSSGNSPYAISVQPAQEPSVSPGGGQEDGFMLETFEAGENLYEIALLMTDLLEAYYGMDVRLGDYQPSGAMAYYRADISDGETIVPMYGVIRPSGFTVNERH